MNDTEERTRWHNSPEVQDALNRAHEQFGHDHIINIVDPYVTKVVNDVHEHNGSALYVDLYSGNAVIEFRYGKSVQFWGSDQELYRAMHRIHYNLWNVLTRPPQDSVVFVDVLGALVSVSVIRPNKDTHQYWTVGSHRRLLVEVEVGIVTSIASDVTVNMLSALMQYHQQENL